MKRVFKISLIVLLCLILAASVGFGIWLLCIPRVRLDETMLDSISLTTRYFDASGAQVIGNMSGKHARFSPIKSLSDDTKNAFVCTEDKRFYDHKGIDYRRMISAVVKNVLSGSPAQGASTITQQLAKNTHLTFDKTLQRKIQEIRLARDLEKRYDKDEILEKYLNVIYFGHNMYGIDSASRYFFDCGASDLTLAQAATLAAMINAPTRYSPILHPDRCVERRNLVLKNMFDQGKIDRFAYERTIDEPLIVTKTESDNAYYLNAVQNEAKSLLNVLGIRDLAGCNVYTNLDAARQSMLVKKVGADDSYRIKAVLSDHAGHILASYSPSFDTVGLRRQPGSTVKPIAVYAPAVERGILTPATPILDEELDIDGYRPKNFGGGHCGWISTRYALAHSNNIAAVKTLRMTGIDYCADFARKLDLPVLEEDRNYAMALGGLTYGFTAESLTGAYSALAADGQFYAPRYVRKITSADGRVLFEQSPVPTLAMSPDTAQTVTDMLRTCATGGTASKLGSLPFQIAAKTGTVGFRSSEKNTDAYSVSYTSEHTLCVWVGAIENDDEHALPGSIRGGTLPTQTARSVWESLYRDATPRNFDCALREYRLDRTSYELDHKVVIAPTFLPDNETFTEKFTLRNAPEPANIISPTLEALVENGCIRLTCRGDRYADYRIVRNDFLDSVTLTVGKPQNPSSHVVYDYTVAPGKFYRYSLLALYPDGSSTLSNPITVFAT